MTENRESYQVSLKIFINNSEGETLVLASVDHGTFAGYYDFPGGRIDKQEFAIPLLDILNREIEEEVGLKGVIINPNPVAVSRHLILSKFTIEKVRDIPVFYVFYEGQYVTGEPTVSDEHKGVQWLKLADINLEQYFTSGILDAVKIYLSNKKLP